MKNIFFIIDCSGSMLYGGPAKVGVINDLMHEVYSNIEQINNTSKMVQTCIITYADKAKVYKDFKDDEFFFEFPVDQFGMRSNLGAAYTLLSQILNKGSLKLKETIIVLISDGMATDNYLSALKNVDGNNLSLRLAFSIGREIDTIEKHVIDNNSLIFKNPDEFIFKLIELMKK